MRDRSTGRRTWECSEVVRGAGVVVTLVFVCHKTHFTSSLSGSNLQSSANFSAPYRSPAPCLISSTISFAGLQSRGKKSKHYNDDITSSTCGEKKNMTLHSTQAKTLLWFHSILQRLPPLSSLSCLISPRVETRGLIDAKLETDSKVSTGENRTQANRLKMYRERKLSEREVSWFTFDLLCTSDTSVRYSSIPISPSTASHLSLLMLSRCSILCACPPPPYHTRLSTFWSCLTLILGV